MPKIIKERQIVDDPWKVLVLAENETPETLRLPIGPLLVPLAVWQARKMELIHRNWEHGEPLGVWLDPGDSAEAVADALADLTVIGIHFPRFADGRGYSTARLLRERHGFRGELRAFGDIGQDQVFFLHRVGFDAFALCEYDPEAIDDVFASFPEVYQAAANEPQPLFRRRAL